MQMKRNMKKIKNRDNYIEAIKTITISLITGAAGFAIGWLFEGKYDLSIITVAMIIIVVIILQIFSIVYERRVSILHILNEDVKKGKFVEAVKLGYSVSRALFLAGRYDERYKISEKICECLEKIPDKQIKINDRIENVALLKAKIEMDDLGWSLYLMNPVQYRESAESKVREALEECVGIVNVDEKKVYTIIFKGLRHLLGMQLDYFDDEAITLIKNEETLKERENELRKYGELLGYLIGDEKMSSASKVSTYLDFFKTLTVSEKRDEEVFWGIKNWINSMPKDDRFFQDTFNFRSKYFLCLSKIYALKLNLTPKDQVGTSQNNNECLKIAMEYAMQMTLGYALSNDNYDWLKNMRSFGTIVTKFETHACKYPDDERYVKGYVLLGTIAMQYNELQSLRDARTAFRHGVMASTAINRSDTYLRSQRKLISVEERILLAKLSRNLLDKDTALEELKRLNDKMNKVLDDTKAHIGYPDLKMVKSCKKRKKKYKNIKKQIMKS